MKKNWKWTTLLPKLSMPRKLLLIMRISFILLFAVLLQVSATGLAQKVVIGESNVTYKQLFKEIRKQTGIVTVLSNDEIDLNSYVTIESAEFELENLLKEITTEIGLTYELIDNYIVITPLSVKEKIIEFVTLQQEKRSITGTIKDNENSPLPFAAVRIKGTSIGTVSDVNGNYNLQFDVQENIILEVSSLGFETQEIAIDGRSVIHITLVASTSGLDEVVIIGFGSKDKKSLTSSIVSMDKEEMERLATTSTTVDNMLGGTMKGVLMTQNSGEPGATPSINIRGITTPYPNMTSGQANNIPLFVIDGIPMFVESNAINPLLALSPNDIKSIDVLKDAAATAIYGSRGANGVIIVTTKSGFKGDKVDIEAGYTFSIGNPINQFDPLNTDEFKNLQDMILSSTVKAINDFRSYADPFVLNSLGHVSMDWNTWMVTYDGLREDAFGTKTTNWVKEVQNKNAPTHQYNIAFRGGTKSSKYSASFNGMNQEGLFINDKLDRYGARLSLDSDISDKLTLGAMMSYSVSERNSATEQSYMTNPIKPYMVRPDVPVYNERGDYNRIDASMMYYGMQNDLANPVAAREKESLFESQQFLGNAYLDYDFTEHFAFHADINLSNYHFENNYFSPLVSKDITYGLPALSSLDASTSSSSTSAVNFRFDYKRKINKHDFAAMAGYGADRMYSKYQSSSFQGFPNDEHMNNAGSARELTYFTDGNNKSGLNSIYGRLSYNFDHRYLVEAAMRADESSKFGPENRWGYFPALSLGWRINNESFLKDVGQIDDLKFRISAGKTGSTNVADFSYKQYFTRSSSDYYGDELSVRIKDLLPNEGVKWELTTEYNAGLDFSFFANRLYGSMDAYYRYTDGALAPAPHILESGLTTYYANVIDMSNKGMEFSLGGDIIRNSNFTWNSNLNISFNRNNIEKLNNASISPYMQDSFIEGQPAGTLRGYKVKEIIQEQSVIDELNMKAIEAGFNNYQEFSTGVGDYLMEDINGDGRITSEDAVVLTNPEPDYFGGWSNTFAYKNVSLSFLLQFSKGVEALWNNLLTDSGGSVGMSVNRELYGNTWTPDNTGARYAQLINSSYGYYNFAQSDRFVFDASYLRMKNINLSYQLPKGFLNRFNIANASVFLAATNVLTITNWPGLDPELLGSGVTSMSSNSDPYPLSKTFSVGIKIKL
ncbi:SusC/RagA family TonB-linked outer membrane protein [Carboxylicivirga sp. N1Y90]|uniref:SusC/RagA family TonB-linked outer membrane protein n=1 Tax=Carboxylicivirga fragile TaxID=3417571 RepID=UPI003D347B52|nr:TonB-dependent receptor [Marinilabiliaceae bacterium N1Y90]